MTAVISSELTSGVQFISGLRALLRKRTPARVYRERSPVGGECCAVPEGQRGREGQELAPVGGARVGGDLPESVCPERGRVRGLGVSGV